MSVESGTKEWDEMIERVAAAERNMRQMKLARTAEVLRLDAFRNAHHNTQRVLEIAIAALEYGQSKHIFNRPCASHPADCTACAALKKLETLVEGPL